MKWFYMNLAPTAKRVIARFNPSVQRDRTTHHGPRSFPGPANPLLVALSEVRPFFRMNARADAPLNLQKVQT
jgi:hypothetical protein